MQVLDYEDQNVIEENEKMFNIYRKLPQIIGLIMLGVCFILGIVFSSVFREEIFLLIFWLSGIVVFAISFYLFKLLLSYKILHIYYMKQIISKIDNLEKKPSQEKQENNVKTTVKSTMAEKVRTNYQAWTCPKCGEKNNGAAKNCINCFEPRP